MRIAGDAHRITTQIPFRRSKEWLDTVNGKSEEASALETLRKVGKGFFRIP
jgi:hypothetical protein